MNCVHPAIVVRQLPPHGRWHIVETENFQVCCQDNPAACVPIARHAEGVKTELVRQWLGDAATVDSPEWSPKCQILLHADQQGYVRAVGRGSEQTAGSSLVEAGKGAISLRRIDLQMSEGDYLNAALPHELTHVVLKDRFPTRPLPRWADEGMALMADPTSKQFLHQRDLHHALRTGSAYQPAELLLMDGYPKAEQWGTFYGQSIALTRFLVERQSHVGFVSFLEKASQSGYDTALRDCYQIGNVHELNRQWRQSLAGQQ